MMRCKKSDESVGENSMRSHTECQPPEKLYTCSDVLFVIAILSIGQGLCFLGVSMLLDDVTVLPQDPLTLIGSMYLATGLGIILISMVLRRNVALSENRVTKDCFPEKCGNKQAEIFKICDDDIDDQGSKERCADEEESCADEEESYADDKERCEVNESCDQHWDIVETADDVINDCDTMSKNTTTVGWDSADI